MSEPSTAELQQLARETFGRELSEEQARSKACRERLPGMVRAVRRLERWQPRLGDTAPAVVHRMPIAIEARDDSA
ncbi:MAG: hypothetical protein ACE5LB_14075, partial [Acidiferrobacterales bacterium]